MEGLVTMSSKELDRAGVLERVLARKLSQRAAAEMLSLTEASASPAAGLRNGRCLSTGVQAAR